MYAVHTFDDKLYVCIDIHHMYVYTYILCMRLITNWGDMHTYAYTYVHRCMYAYALNVWYMPYILAYDMYICIFVCLYAIHAYRVNM